MKKNVTKQIIGICLGFVIFFVLLAYSVSNHYMASEYDELLSKGESGLNEWFENHPEFVYTYIYRTEVYKYADYILPYIKCTFYNADNDWQRLYYDIYNDKVLIEVDYEVLPEIFGNYYSQYSGLDRDLFNYEMYFGRNETVEMNRTNQVFYSKTKVEQKEHEFHNCLLYEDYLELESNPGVIFNNVKNKVSAKILVEDDVYLHDFKLEKFIFEHPGVRYITARNDKKDEELSIRHYDDEYNLYYQTYLEYNYSQIMQIKYRQELYKELNEKNDVYQMVNSFIEKQPNIEELFDVQVSATGIDIKTDVSGYSLYFSSVKFLEGQTITYIQPYAYGDEKKVNCTFKEVNNGKYPYALADENNRVESFWRDTSFYYK